MRVYGRSLVLLFCMVLGAGVVCSLRAQTGRSPEFRAALGQTFVTVSGTWAFRTGDNLKWAQPTCDDSQWETISADQPWDAQGHPGYTGYAWYRRSLRIDGVTGPVSIYMPPVSAVYELYWNGERIGRFGKMPPHAQWSFFALRNVFSMPRPQMGDKGSLQGVLAIRVWKPMLSTVDPPLTGGLSQAPLVGSTQALVERLTTREASAERASIIVHVIYSILLLMGLMTLGMWASDRRDSLYLWLSTFMLSNALQGWSFFPAIQRLVPFDWTITITLAIEAAGDISLWFLLLVLFRLNQSRGWRAATWVITAIYLVATVIDGWSVFFWSSGWTPLRTIDLVSTIFIECLPCYLFVLLAAGLLRRREAALLPAVLSCVVVEISLLSRNALTLIASRYSVFERYVWASGFQLGPYQVPGSTESSTLLVVTLVWTVYHERRRERRRRLFVEAEIKSAQEIQQVLVPEDTPAVPGFAVSSLYWPAGEVGGDMFQVIPGKDGDLTLIIADVSGKGLKAAMTVSLMVGAARTLVETTTQPGAILAGLNRRLMGRTNGGFATCLVLHVTAAGDVAIANAGHLAPFLNGQEMEIEGSLPLGISYDADFSESRIFLRESDELTLFTDGVLEAQNKSGELYGFHRCAELMRSGPSVQAIAEAAKAFGQSDDITVVKLVRVHAEDARARMSVDLQTMVVA